ncbi:MAG: right-handed parallel beta-helix repeat-containing protein, partial [Nanoarchaeota archaeon]|nr:right-handed parallel beta-helix repeat-containing protein [Nanoarchaeota archaeon]
TTIGGDCGPANITYPAEGASYRGSIAINWTEQSSINNISYYLYYSSDNGSTWNYLDSTPSLYTWDVSAMMGTGFRLMTIPYDDYYNATNDIMSSSFTILPDNEYVCSNSSYCEYTNLTLALIGEDNSNNTIYLIEPNSTYIISNTSFNISPSGLYPAIQVNASNITIDCNGSSISDSGNGIGIYSAFSNTTIINCNISNYQYGIVLESSLNNTIANSTIFNNSIAGVLLNNTNFSSITGNTFNNTNTSDLYINGTNNTIWLNNFYGGGVNDTSINDYCIDSYGNYYSSTVSPSNILNGSCGVLTLPYADNDDDGYYTTNDCNDASAAVSPGTPETCNGRDDNCNGQIDETCPPPDEGKKGGAKSGGPALATKRYTIDDNTSISIRAGEEVILEVFSQVYRMKLNKVYSDHIQLSIPTDETYYELYIGQSKSVDLDGDGEMDISITLAEIPDGYSILLVSLFGAETAPQQEIFEPEPFTEITGEGVSGESTQEPSDGEQPARYEGPAVITKTPAKTSILPYILIAIAALVLIGGAGAGAYYFIATGKKAVEHQVSDLQPYVNHEHSLGIVHDVIKAKLTESGWDADIIDKALGSAKKIPKFDEVKEYISKSLSSGKSEQQVKDSLIKTGWSKRDVDLLVKK